MPKVDVRTGKVNTNAVISLGEKFFWLLALIALGFYVYFLFQIGFWGDKDWELYVASLLLEGKKLYIDHFPVSPPFIFYLYTIPVALARLVGVLKDFQWLALLGLCVCAYSIFLCTDLMVNHPALANDAAKRRQWFALLVFVLIFRIHPAFFFDREHIFLVLTLPYALRWMPSLAQRTYSVPFKIIIGCMAGIGFCIKPHCLIVLACIQLICFFRDRSLAVFYSIESLLIYLIGLAYLAAVWWLTPEYFLLVAPMAMDTYSAINSGISGVFINTILFMTFLTFVFFRPNHVTAFRSDIFYLTGLSLGFLAYALANNGWGYTYNLVVSALLIVNGFVLWEFLYLRKQQKSSKQSSELAAWGIASCVFNFVIKAAMVLVFFFTVLTESCHNESACTAYYDKFLKEIHDEHASSFGAITMDFAIWARVSKLSGAQWQTRFPQLWMLPKFLIADNDFIHAHQWIMYYVAGAFADDLNNKKPTLVFVDIPDIFYTIKSSTNLVSYLSQFKNFAEAWQHYVLLTTIDNCEEFKPSDRVVQQMPGQQAMHRLNCRYEVYRRAF